MDGMLDDNTMDFDGPMGNTILQDSMDGRGEHMLNMTTQQNVQHSNENPVNIDDQPTGGAGAGPLPTGFGMINTTNNGSTLTDFTKRRNWPHRVVEELKDLLNILSADGRILYSSPSAKTLTGYTHEELLGKFIVDFIHSDDSAIFVREFNEAIASGHTLRLFYRFKKQDGQFTIFEVHGHPHLTSEAAQYGPGSSASFCRGFFMMARPYPTKNAMLLDSFLEHKIENERLMSRIAVLKQEEMDEAEDVRRHMQKKLDQSSDVTPSDDYSRSVASTVANSADLLAMPPPAMPSESNVSLTRSNLENVNATSGPDSIKDKMARYEGATHVETIEMLTGLRYQDGERSQGISTGGNNGLTPTLIKGDAGIAISSDRDGRLDKKKKPRVADEYVCTDCGTHCVSNCSVCR